MFTYTLEYRKIPTSLFSDTPTDDSPDDGGFFDSAFVPADPGELLHSETTTVDPSDGSGVTFTHDGTPPEYPGLSFVFWNLTTNAPPGDYQRSSDLPSSDPNVHLEIHEGAARGRREDTYTLTAWYAPPGRGGGGSSVINARAFSIGDNRFFKRTPVESVDPAADWLGGYHHYVSTEQANAAGRVVIAPQRALYHLAYEVTGFRADFTRSFRRWIGRRHLVPHPGPGGGRLTWEDDRDYTASRGAGGLAVAAYDLEVQGKRINYKVDPVVILPDPIIDRLTQPVEEIEIGATRAALGQLRPEALDRLRARMKALTERIEMVNQGLTQALGDKQALGDERG